MTCTACVKSRSSHYDLHLPSNRRSYCDATRSQNPLLRWLEMPCTATPAQSCSCRRRRAWEDNESASPSDCDSVNTGRGVLGCALCGSFSATARLVRPLARCQRSTHMRLCGRPGGKMAGELLVWPGQNGSHYESDHTQ
jgi:hypothetical protein